YEIIVRGKTVETKVNGQTVVRYEEEADRKGKRKLSAGTFGIQAHDPGSVVLVKNIKVKPLVD
ncbi:MAG: family 16 glycoside hydrolase, partial [Verrucomicrobiia bacterium]